MRFGGEKPRFYLLLLVRTTQEKALKKLMATVNVVYHLGEILKKWAFCLFLTWDGVRSRSNGRGYFAEWKSTFVCQDNTELMFSWLRLTLCISGVTGVGVPLPTFSLYKTYASPMDPKRKKELQLQKFKQNRSFFRRLRLLNYLGSKIRWKEICFQSKLVIVTAPFQSRTLSWNPCSLKDRTIVFCA